MSSQTTTPSPPVKKPSVAIVGAGIAGLTLAILLDRQGVDYQIYERASELKPIGAAMSLGANVTPLFKQLGLYEAFLKIAKPWYGIKVYDNRGQLSRLMDISVMKEMAGDDSYVVARPALHGFLMRQIPTERFHLGNRVVSLTQDENGVTFLTSDNQTHQADILIGADGAHSAVRQSLYTHLKAEKKLPVLDNVPLPFSTVCLVGQTRELDPEEYPCVNTKEAQFTYVENPGSPYAISTFTTAQNTWCWSVIQHLNEESTSVKDDGSRDSEWGPEAAEAMCNEVRHIVVPGAAPGETPWTLGTLFDLATKDCISKVMLEEKLFDTWHSGRTVLIGDACHKISPAGGHGAINAIHDAITIANWVSVLPSTELKDVDEMFQQYKKERYPPAKKSFNTSRVIAKSGGTTLQSRILKFVSNHLPDWMMKMALAKTAAMRPQVSFLPQVEDNGSVKVAYQPSLDKTLKIAKAAAARNSTKAA